MRFVIKYLLAVVLIILSSATDVSAQSFFEQLFGGWSGPQLAPQSGQHGQQRVVPQRPLRGPDGASTQSDPNQRRPREAGGKLQTMCVRTCDGYYWPIRYPASRDELDQDAATCQSSCDTQTRLYTRSGPGADADSMTDKDGGTYGSSATAFVYRKRLVDGCSCRPMPWAASETARHERYALIETEKKIQLAEAQRATQRQAEDRLANGKLSGQAHNRVDDPVAHEPSPQPVHTPSDPAALAGDIPAAPTGAVTASNERPAAALRSAQAGAKIANDRRDQAKTKTRPVRMAAHQPKPTAGLFQFASSAPKYRYPGD